MDTINFIFLRSMVTADAHRNDQERLDYLTKLNSHSDFVFDKSGRDVFFIETGGTEELFKRVYKEYKEPYVILATNANNSLPASLEIATFLRKNNKKFKVIHGTPEEVINQLKSIEIENLTENCRDFVKTNLLNNKRFGVIGKPSDWLIASDVDYKEVEEKLGAELVDISTDEFIELIASEDNKVFHGVFDDFANDKINKETLDGAMNIYGALLALVEKYNLDGLTVRCFDLLSSVKNTSCLALALLNQDGIIATCEGDIPAMLSMAIVKEAFGQSSFQVNPSYLNLEKQYGYFAHCTVPLDMCKMYSFDTHFESGIGVGVKGELKEQKVTIFKLNANLRDYEIFEGTIFENLNKDNLCRTQVKVSFSEDIKEMFSLPNGNHLIIFYGSHKKELVKILSN